MSAVFTPYSSVFPFIRGMPTWVPEDAQQRIASYQTYEEIYWSHPTAFELQTRGANAKPIYIPSSQTIVNTTAHFMLKGLNISPVDPEANAEMTATLNAFLRRERFYSRFHTAKQSGVVRGDWIMHVTADPEKPEGTRLSMNSVDPASYFPVESDDDLDSIERVHLVEQFTDGDEVKVKKLTYWYETEGGTRKVFREESIYALDDWAEPGASAEQVIHPPAALPDPITAIPVYHFKNRDWQGQPFGSSELRGFESLMASINQSISDEDLALALEGLGVYATDADAPTDSDGNPQSWTIAPAKVIEHEDGKKFYRVEGIQSVNASLDHIKFLLDSLYEGTGTTEVARGAVDVTTAESGIALQIKFTPTLAKIELRDLSGIDTLTQMFFDWKRWHAAYEGQDFLEVDILPALGAKLPMNRELIREELNDMLEQKVISRKYYRQKMAELFDYEFPDDIDAQIVQEEAALTEAMDMLGTRVSEEAE